MQPGVLHACFKEFCEPIEVRGVEFKVCEERRDAEDVDKINLLEG